jgi:hypothetical protein
MSKEKNKKAEVVAEVKPVKPVGPTAGLKPISCGLQPIIAPKGQVQLAPIVVPVAFAPYGTQNQPMLQYEKSKKAASEITDQPLDNTVAPDAKRKKKNAKVAAAEGAEESKKNNSRKLDKGAMRAASIAAIVMCLLYLAPTVLTYIAPDLEFMGSTIKDLGFPKPFGIALSGGFLNSIHSIVKVAAFGLAAINLLLAIVALISGKNPKLGLFGVLVFITTFLPAIFSPELKIDAAFIAGWKGGEGSGIFRMIIISLVLMIVELMFRGKKVKSDFDEKTKKGKKGKKAKKADEALAGAK